MSTKARDQARQPWRDEIRAETKTRGLAAAALRTRDAVRQAYRYSANSYTFDALNEVERLLCKIDEIAP
jgi:hypothetical protein